jgi:hypothetical protein
MNSPEKNNLDELFRKGFESEETAPPSAGWAQMESLLDAQEAGGKKKNRVIAWYWSAAAVVLPFLIGGIWFLRMENSEMTAVIAPPGIPSREEKQNQPLVEKSGTTLELASLPKTNGEVAVSEKPVAGKRNRVQNKEVKSLAPQETTIALAPAKGQPSEENPQVTPPEEIRVSKDEPRPPLETASLQELKAPEVLAGETEIASIEFRSSNKKPEEEIASVEWKKGPKPRRNLGESIARLREESREIIPNLNQAKDNLVAFLGFRK